MADVSSASSDANVDAMAKFLSFLSHDLRGGLNGAVLMLEVVRRQLTKDPKQSETLGDLEMVRHSILETVALMDRFVLAERLRLGRVNVNLSGVDISKLLAQLAKEFRSNVNHPNAVVDIDCDADLIVQTDEALLKRVLGNMLDNALKFGRRQPVQLRAICGAAATSATAARIEIVDHGNGFTAEKLATLNEPVDVAEAYGQKGGGIGLYIARRAAKLLGATLHSESTAGGGTTMILELPQLTAATIK